ncbi:hypothetical protein DENSPDRAFT_75421 [Dentipellis sp. KUC8613]|nr:hypothetical protein DENSPDRAFT_75421 [Dentipellis sp. KUC8613]
MVPMTRCCRRAPVAVLLGPLQTFCEPLRFLPSLRRSHTGYAWLCNVCCVRLSFAALLNSCIVCVCTCDVSAGRSFPCTSHLAMLSGWSGQQEASCFPSSNSSTLCFLCFLVLILLYPFEDCHRRNSLYDLTQFSPLSPDKCHVRSSRSPGNGPSSMHFRSRRHRCWLR